MLLSSSCALCGLPGSAVCLRCSFGLSPAPALATPLGLDGCIALLDYAPARALITSLKNGGRRDLVAWLAERIAAELEPGPGAVITWAPTGAARRRGRGYDQAELLARAVGRRCQIACRPLLRRAPGPAQAGRSSAQRRLGPVFEPVRSVLAPVIVIDDVLTTGATLTAAARALRSAGASTVVGVVAARAAGRPRR